MQKNPASFEHVPPESVGNSRKVVMSELSGGANVTFRLKQLGPDYDDISKEEVGQILAELKAQEGMGYTFESADASFQLLVQKALKRHSRAFELEALRVIVEKRGIDDQCVSEATIKLSVDGKTEHTVGEGAGPVEALDHALRKALARFFPQVADVVLTDFRVRILDPKEAAGAVTRVLVESSDGKRSWGTVGVSPNIIEASWQALLDAIEYKLLIDGANH